MAQPAKSPEMLFSTILNVIEQNQVKLHKGEEIDLVGLEKQVEGLCKEVQALSHEEAMKYREKLESLFQQLADLGNKLIQLHAATGKEIAELSLRHKASVAYAKTGGNTDKK